LRRAEGPAQPADGGGQGVVSDGAVAPGGGNDLALPKHASARAGEQKQQVHEPRLQPHAFAAVARQEATRGIDLPVAKSEWPLVGVVRHAAMLR
jgi:hypothetical protein